MPGAIPAPKAPTPYVPAPSTPAGAAAAGGGATGVAGRRGYFRAHSGDLSARLQAEIPHETLLALHKRAAWRHFLVAARNVALHLLCLWVAVTHSEPWIWIPAALIQGTVLLGFTILLHDVIHDCVFKHRRGGVQRVLGLLYAMPVAMSASQFTRWHLDHHRELGSSTADPKRAHLSPKRNARWLKILYMTPALFPIYARAAATAAAGYPRELRRRFALERFGNVLIHAGLVAAIWTQFDGAAVLRAYVVPVLFGFPIAFMINRLGQHYWVDSSDPAKWGTRVDGSLLTRFFFLNSNYHLEHHYFPSVPLYRLPALNRALRPFFERIGHPSRSYPRLLWKWLGKNCPAHADWD